MTKALDPVQRMTTHLRDTLSAPGIWCHFVYSHPAGLTISGSKSIQVLFFSEVNTFCSSGTGARFSVLSGAFRNVSRKVFSSLALRGLGYEALYWGGH